MLIALDPSRCTKCGVCFRTMEGFCISRPDGWPVFDASLCNTCQKCVAVCPSQAITVNGVHPVKMTRAESVNPEQIRALLERRRSTKQFLDKPVPRAVLEQIVSAAAFAPNQNKNLSLAVIEDPDLIREIDRAAVSFVKTTYRLLFSFPPLTAIIRFFYRDIGVIRRKMEHGNFRRVVYENARAVVVVHGDKSVPVTERSSHYLLSAMMVMAEALGVGSCLMDSVYLAFRTSRTLRRKLGIRDDVFGALVLGYSGETVVNIPKGYEVPVQWNGKSPAGPESVMEVPS